MRLPRLDLRIGPCSNCNGLRSILQLLADDDSTSTLSLRRKGKDKRFWELLGSLYQDDCDGPGVLLECSVCCGACGNSFIQGVQWPMLV